MGYIHQSKFIRYQMRNIDENNIRRNSQLQNADIHVVVRPSVELPEHDTIQLENGEGGYLPEEKVRWFLCYDESDRKNASQCIFKSIVLLFSSIVSHSNRYSL